MIFIYGDDSNIHWVPTKLIKYLTNSNREFVRMNEKCDLFSFQLSLDKSLSSIAIDNYDLSEISAVFIYSTNQFYIKSTIDTNLLNDVTPHISEEILHGIRNEFVVINEFIIAELSSKKGVIFHHPNKLKSLFLAQKVGLNISKSFISQNTYYTKSKTIISNFITKPITNVYTFDDSNIFVESNNVILKDSLLDNCDKTIFPIFVERFVDAKFELRVIFIGIELFSVAVFPTRYNSQNDIRVTTNLFSPNRQVPYQLSPSEERMILNLILQTQISFGIIDFIVDYKGVMHFLEMNGSGSAELLSYNCNYNLEKYFEAMLIQTPTRK